MNQTNSEHTPTAAPLISGKTAFTLMDTVDQLNREVTQTSTDTGDAIKSEILSAEKALNDITDIAGTDEIDGTQIDLLARLLEDRAEAAYDVVTDTANWSTAARAALYAVPGLDEGAVA